MLKIEEINRRASVFLAADTPRLGGAGRPSIPEGSPFQVKLATSRPGWCLNHPTAARRVACLERPPRDRLKRNYLNHQMSERENDEYQQTSA